MSKARPPLARLRCLVGKAAISGVVSFILLGQACLAEAAQASLWADRRGHLPAAVPAAVPPLPPAAPLPKLKATDEAVAAATAAGARAAVTPGAPDRVLVLLQDIHANPEAQRNLERVIETLVPHLDLLALEGTQGEKDLSAFRNFGDAHALGVAARYFVGQGTLSGAAAAAILAPRALSVVGVDDAALHRANVDAYLRSRAARGRFAAQIAAARASVDRAPVSAGLRSFDAEVRAYHTGREPLGRYLTSLTRVAGERPMAALFLQALSREKTVDAAAVERERTAALGRLAGRLTPDRAAALLADAAAFRAGTLSPGAFYRRFADEAARAGVPLDGSPALKRYIDYVLIADRLDAEALFDDLSFLEDAGYRRLARDSADAAWAARSRFLTLADGLAAFTLNRCDWRLYDRLRADPAVAAERAALDLAGSFEDFYRVASRRDAALGDRLLAACEHGRPHLVAAVAGGFHVEGLAARAGRAGWTVVTVTPRMTQADPSKASAYLSLFAREKTPLEKLFAPERLFVSPDPFEAASRLPPVTAAVRFHEGHDDAAATVHALAPRVSVDDVRARRLANAVEVAILSDGRRLSVVAGFHPDGEIASLAERDKNVRFLRNIFERAKKARRVRDQRLIMYGSLALTAALVLAIDPVFSVGVVIGASLARRPSGPKTVLYVEDHDDTRKTTRWLLEANGYEVIPAASVPEALAALDKHRDDIDVVLTDFDLGRGGDADALYAAVRADPRNEGLSVIILSGRERDDILAAGIPPDVRSLKKPAVIGAVLDALNDAVHERRGDEGTPEAPAAPPAVNPPASPPAETGPPAAEAPLITGKKVLLVEGGAIPRTLITRLLQKKGVDVEAVDDPEQAFALLAAAREDYGVVLSELAPGDMTPADFLARVGDGTPVVFQGLPSRDEILAAGFPADVRYVERGADFVPDLWSAVGGALGVLPVLFYIEDSARMRAWMTRAFIDLGYEVVAVGSGAEAMRLMPRYAGRLTAIVSDFDLPPDQGRPFKGDEILRRVRADPATANVPFAFLTARTERAPGVPADVPWVIKVPIPEAAAKVQSALFPQSVFGVRGGPLVYGVLMPIVEEAARHAIFLGFHGFLSAVIVWSVVHALLHVFTDVREGGWGLFFRRLPARFGLSVAFGLAYWIGPALVGADPGGVASLVFAVLAHAFNNLVLASRFTPIMSIAPLGPKIRFAVRAAATMLARAAGETPSQNSLRYVPAPPTATFLGGARGIGNSSTLITVGGKRVLVDAGLNFRDRDPFPRFDLLTEPPDAIVITHAHTDHIGALPLLWKRYPGVPIYASRGTIHLMRAMLPGSLRSLRSHGINGADVEDTLRSLIPIETGVRYALGEQAWIRAIDAGHLLGAVSLEFGSLGGHAVVTGDIGRQEQITVGAAAVPEPGADLFVVEGTLGDRDVPARADEAVRFLQICRDTFARGGNVIIPSLALARSQEILLLLRDAQAGGDAALRGFEIVYDGMINLTTPAFMDAVDQLPEARRGIVGREGGLYNGEGVTIRPVRDFERERIRDRLDGGEGKPYVVVAPAGMLNAGHILDYVEAGIEDPKNTIVFVNYQPTGGLGLRILEAKQRGTRLQMEGQLYQVSAAIESVSLSGHASGPELEAYVAQAAPRAGGLALVHGHPNGLAGLAARPKVAALSPVIPAQGDTVTAARPRLRTSLARLADWLTVPRIPLPTTPMLPQRPRRETPAARPAPSQPRPAPAPRRPAAPARPVALARPAVPVSRGQIVVVRSGSENDVALAIGDVDGVPSAFRARRRVWVNRTSKDRREVPFALGSADGVPVEVLGDLPALLDADPRTTALRLRAFEAAAESLLGGDARHLWLAVQALGGGRPMSIADMADAFLSPTGDAALGLRREWTRALGPIAADPGGPDAVAAHNSLAALVGDRIDVAVRVAIAQRLRRGAEPYFSIDPATGLHVPASAADLIADHGETADELDREISIYALPLGSEVTIPPGHTVTARIGGEMRKLQFGDTASARLDGKFGKYVRITVLFEDNPVSTITNFQNIRLPLVDEGPQEESATGQIAWVWSWLIPILHDRGWSERQINALGGSEELVFSALLTSGGAALLALVWHVDPVTSLLISAGASLVLFVVAHILGGLIVWKDGRLVPGELSWSNVLQVVELGLYVRLFSMPLALLLPFGPLNVVAALAVAITVHAVHNALIAPRFGGVVGLIARWTAESSGRRRFANASDLIAAGLVPDETFREPALRLTQLIEAAELRRKNVRGWERILESNVQPRHASMASALMRGDFPDGQMGLFWSSLTRKELTDTVDAAELSAERRGEYGRIIDALFAAPTPGRRPVTLTLSAETYAALVPVLAAMRRSPSEAPPAVGTPQANAAFLVRAGLFPYDPFYESALHLTQLIDAAVMQRRGAPYWGMALSGDASRYRGMAAALMKGDFPDDPQGRFWPSLTRRELVGIVNAAKLDAERRAEYRRLVDNLFAARSAERPSVTVKLLRWTYEVIVPLLAALGALPEQKARPSRRDRQVAAMGGTEELQFSAFAVSGSAALLAYLWSVEPVTGLVIASVASLLFFTAAHLRSVLRWQGNRLVRGPPTWDSFVQITALGLGLRALYLTLLLVLPFGPFNFPVALVAVIAAHAVYNAYLAPLFNGAVGVVDKMDLDPVHTDEVALSTQHLRPYLVGAADKWAAALKERVVTPADENATTTVMKNGAVTVNLYLRRSGSYAVWCFKLADLNQAAQLVGARVRDQIRLPSVVNETAIDASVTELLRTETSVSAAGMNTVAYGERDSLLSAITALLGDPPNAAATKTLGEGDAAVTFVTRRNFVKLVWAFPTADAKKVAALIGATYRDPAIGEVKSDETPISGGALKPFAGGNTARVAAELNKLLGEPPLAPVTTTLGEGDAAVTFTVRELKGRPIWTVKTVDVERTLALNDATRPVKERAPRSTARRAPSLAAGRAPFVREGDVVVGGERLSEIFVGSPGDILAKVRPLLGDPPSTSEEKTLGEGTNAVRFYTRTSGTVPVWAFNEDDIDRVAALFALIRRDSPDIYLKDDETPVSIEGVKSAFFGTADTIADIILGWLGGQPTNYEPRIVGEGAEAITFYVRKSGRKSQWAFKTIDAAKVAARVGYPLRTEAARPLDEKNEIQANRNGVIGLFVRDAGTVADALAEKLGKAPMKQESKVLEGNGERVEFFSRVHGTVLVWAFRRTDIAAVGKMFGWEPTVAPFPEVGAGEIAASRNGLAAAFVGNPNDWADFLSNDLGAVPAVQTEKLVTRKGTSVTFFVRMNGPQRVWAFKRTELPALAKMLDATIREGEIPQLGEGETALTTEALASFFIGNSLSMLRAVKAPLGGEPPEKPETKTVRLGDEDVTFFTRRRSATTIWAYRTEDLPKIQKFLGATLRLENAAAEITADDVAVTGKGLTAYFAGTPNTMIAALLAVLGDVVPGHAEKVVETADGPVTFTVKRSGTSHVWTFPKADAARVGRHFSFADVSAGIQNATDDDVLVSGAGMARIFFSGDHRMAARLILMLEGKPKNSTDTKTLEIRGRKVTFYVRGAGGRTGDEEGAAARRGRPTWAFSKKDAVTVALLLNLRIREDQVELTKEDRALLAQADQIVSDIPALAEGELAVSRGLQALIVGNNSITQKIHDRIGRPPSTIGSVTVGEGDAAVTFENRRVNSNIVWAFPEDDLAKVAALFGFTVRETDGLTQLGADEVSTAGPALTRFFVGTGEKLNGAIKEQLGNPPEAEVTRTVTANGQTVEFFVRKAVTRTVWAFKRATVAAVATVFGFQLKTDEIRPIGSDEVAVSQRGIEEVFVGSSYAPVILERLGEVPEQAVTKTLGEGDGQVTFFTRKIGEKTNKAGAAYMTRTVWAFRRADAEKVAKIFGLRVRAGDVPAIQPGEIGVTIPALRQRLVGNAERYVKSLKALLGEPPEASVEKSLWDGENRVTFTVRKTGIDSARPQTKFKGYTAWTFKEADLPKVAAIFGAELRDPTVPPGKQPKRRKRITVLERAVETFQKYNILDLAVALSSNPTEMQQALAVILAHHGVDMTEQDLGELSRAFILNLREGGHPGNGRGFTPGNPIDYLRALMALQAEASALSENEQLVLIRAFIRLAYPRFAHDYEGTLAEVRRTLGGMASDPLFERLVAHVEDSLGRGLTFQPKHITTPLLPHQRVGAWAMRSSENLRDQGIFGFLLEDDTRLGKTIQTFAAMDPTWKAVVAVPAGVMDTWHEQYELHTDRSFACVLVRGTPEEKRRIILENRDKKGVMLVMSIEDLRGRSDDEFAALNHGLDLVVVDEGQRIENYGGQELSTSSLQARAIHRLLASRRWILSASPYTSHPRQLFSVFNLLHTDPKTGKVTNDLYANRRAFNQLLAGGLRQMRWLYALKARIGLRRTKAEMGRVYTTKHEVDPAQEGRYAVSVDQARLVVRIIKNLGDYVQAYNARVAPEDRIQQRSIGALLKLQFLSWALTEPSVLNEPIATPYWDAMDRIVTHRLRERKKGIIFAQNTAIIDRVVQRYEAQGFRVARIDGTVTGHAVVDGRIVVDEDNQPVSAQAYQRHLFQQPDSGYDLVVMNVRAGVGLDLSRAEWELYAQLPNNYVEYYQSSDRALGINPDRTGRTQKAVDVMFMMPTYPAAFLAETAGTPDQAYVEHGTPYEILYRGIMGEDRARFELVMEGIQAERGVSDERALTRLVHAVHGFLEDPSLSRPSAKERRQIDASSAFVPVYRKVRGNRENEDAVLTLVERYSKTDVSARPIAAAIAARNNFDPRDLKIIAAVFDIPNKAQRDAILGMLPDLYGLVWRHHDGLAALSERGPPELSLLLESQPELFVPFVAATQAWNSREDEEGTQQPVHPGSMVLMQILEEFYSDGFGDYDRRQWIRRYVEALMNLIDGDRPDLLDFLAHHQAAILDEGVALTDKIQFLEKLGVLRQANPDGYRRLLAQRGTFDEARQDIRAQMRSTFVDLFGLPDNDATVARVMELSREWDGLEAPVLMMTKLRNGPAETYGEHVAMFRQVMRHIVDGTYAAWRNRQEGDPTGHEIAYRADDPTFWEAFTREETADLGRVTVSPADAGQVRAQQTAALLDRMHNEEALVEAFGDDGRLILADLTRADAETDLTQQLRVKGGQKQALENAPSEANQAALRVVRGELKSLGLRLRAVQLVRALQSGAVSDELPGYITAVRRSIRDPKENEDNLQHIAVALRELQQVLERQGKPQKFENVTVQFTSDPNLMMRRGMLHEELRNCFNLHAGVRQIATLVDDLAARNKMLAIVRVGERIASVAIVKVRRTESGRPVLMIERPLYRWGYNFEREIAHGLAVTKAPRMPDALIAGDWYKGAQKLRQITVFGTGARGPTEYHETLFGWRPRAARISHIAGVFAEPVSAVSETEAATGSQRVSATGGPRSGDARLSISVLFAWLYRRYTGDRRWFLAVALVPFAESLIAGLLFGVWPHLFTLSPFLVIPLQIVVGAVLFILIHPRVFYGPSTVPEKPTVRDRIEIGFEGAIYVAAFGVAAVMIGPGLGAWLIALLGIALYHGAGNWIGWEKGELMMISPFLIGGGPSPETRAARAVAAGLLAARDGDTAAAMRTIADLLKDEPITLNVETIDGRLSALEAAARMGRFNEATFAAGLQREIRARFGRDLTETEARLLVQRWVMSGRTPGAAAPAAPTSAATVVMLDASMGNLESAVRSALATAGEGGAVVFMAENDERAAAARTVLASLSGTAVGVDVVVRPDLFHAEGEALRVSLAEVSRAATALPVLGGRRIGRLIASDGVALDAEGADETLRAAVLVILSAIGPVQYTAEDLDRIGRLAHLVAGQA